MQRWCCSNAHPLSAGGGASDLALLTQERNGYDDKHFTKMSQGLLTLVFWVY